MNFKAGAIPIIAILVVVLLAAAVGGYFLLSKGGGVPVTLPGVMPRATEKDFEFLTDPLLRKNFVAQANTTSWRTKTLSSGKGTLDTTEVQIRGEEFRWHALVNDGSKDVSEMITIADTTYVKDFSDGKWWKQTAKKEAPTAEQKPLEETKPEDFKTELTKDKDTLSYKQLGKEPCGPPAGGLTCYKYQQIDSQNPESKRIFWFDDRQYLLRKDETAFGEFTVTTEYSYDNINISTPSPTKDVPEGRNIYEYLYGTPTSPAAPTQPSPAELQQLQQLYQMPPEQ